MSAIIARLKDQLLNKTMEISMKKQLLAIASAGLICCTNASFAKSTIGGIIFTNSFYESRDIGNETLNRTVVDIDNNSRLRVRWTNEDNVGMYIETGVGDSVSLRHAFGTWNVNENWQILAGQTSTPFAPLNPDVAMVNNSGQSVGNVSPGRQSQVRFTYRLQNRKGAFAFAFLDPNTGDTLVDNTNTSTVNNGRAIGLKSSVFPRIDLGGAYRTFNWQLFPSAFVHQQTYDLVNNNVSDDNLTIWGASLGVRRGFGPWVLAAEAGVGENWGNTKMSQSGSPAGDNAGAIVFANNNGTVGIADSTNQNYWIDLGYRFTAGQAQGIIHFIAGQSNSKVDDLGDDYSSSMLGISAPIDLPWIARGFRIRPEIFYFDNGGDNIISLPVISDPTQRFAVEVDSGSRTIVGVQLQYTF